MTTTLSPSPRPAALSGATFDAAPGKWLAEPVTIEQSEAALAAHRGHACAAYAQSDEWPNEATEPLTDIYRLYPDGRAEVLSKTREKSELREKGAAQRNRYTMKLTWAAPLPGMTPRFMVVHDPQTAHLTSQAFRRDGADRHALMIDKLANATALTEHLQNGAEIRWAYWRDFESKQLSECCGGRVMWVRLYSPKPLPGCCGCGYLSLSVCAECGAQR